MFKFKSKKFWLLWIAAIAVALMMPSCSDSPDTEGGEEEKPTPTLTVPGTYYYNDYLHITFASGGIVRISDDDDLDVRGTFTVTGSTFTLSGITGAGWAEGTWTIVNATTVKDSDGDEWTRGTLIPIPEITATLTVPGTYYYSDSWHITFADDGVVRVVTSSLDEIGTYTVDGATFTLSGIDGADWITGTWTIVDAETIIDSDDDDWVLGTLIPIPEAGTAPTITTTSLADGTVGVEYSQTLAATGDTPITWEISDGELPDGLSLTGSTISGTPTVAGVFEFAVTATNDEGSDTEDFTIEIEGPAGPVEVDITGKSRIVIQGEIQNALNAGDDVKTIGTLLDQASTLELNIPANRTLYWEADYGQSSSAIVRVAGAGDVIIANGGRIGKTSGTGVALELRNFSGTLTVGNNGEISSANTSLSIDIGSSNAVVRILENGRVEAGAGIGIRADNAATIFIEGGTVSNSNGTWPGIRAGAQSKFAISGGMITRGGTGTGAAIEVQGFAEIYVSGTPQILDGRIHRMSTGSGVGYYTGDNLEKFNTATGANIWTVDENLHNETPDWAE